MNSTGENLLSITQAILKFSFITCATLIVIQVVLAAFIFVAPEHAGIAGANMRLDPKVALGVTQRSLIAGIAISALFLAVLRSLRQIVDSAATGDPFIQQNATRLKHIAWLTLAMNVVHVAYGFANDLFAREAQVGFNLAIIPWAGFFSVLMILVVAQIFQRGSEMRADLEGTV
jgi:hypothetical protein